MKIVQLAKNKHAKFLKSDNNTCGEVVILVIVSPAGKTDRRYISGKLIIAMISGGRRRMKRRRLFGGCLAGACGAAMGTEAPPSPAVRSSPCSRSPLHALFAPHHPLPLGQAHPSGASIPSPPLHPCNVKFRGGRGAGSCVCLRGPGLSTVDDGLSRSRTGGQTRHRDASVRPAGQTDQDQELLRFHITTD